MRQALFSEKTRPRCSSRSNIAKGRLLPRLRAKCPSLQFPGLRRALEINHLDRLFLRRKVASDTDLDGGRGGLNGLVRHAQSNLGGRHGGGVASLKAGEAFDQQPLHCAVGAFILEMGVVSDYRCDPNIADLLEILDLAGHIRDQPLDAPGGGSRLRIMSEDRKP